MFCCKNINVFDYRMLPWMPLELLNTGPRVPNICTVLISETLRGVWIRDHEVV